MGPGWGGFAGDKYQTDDPWNWSGPVADIADFLILSDINTLRNSDSSLLAKSLAAVNLVPIGKIIKGSKMTLQFLNKEGKLIEKEFQLTGDALTAAKKAGCNCFTAGTKVQTDEGEKPIEEIEVGDRVLSKNEETGEQAYKEVTHLYRNDKEIIFELTVGDQVIETTDNHPFWVEGKGYVLAADLQVGDRLQQSNGNTLTIDKINIVKHDEKVEVYNFTVADFHTYFVSDLGIWVHNTGCDVMKVWDLEGTGDAISKKNLKDITENMKKNGWVGDPIEIYQVNGKNLIVNGHHRAKAARQAGIENVPVKMLTEQELKEIYKRTPEQLLNEYYGR
ncbi:polymorphic toxin-type HINT domain-containing protein [Paenibacillus camerounensis]|uniref:polymorphic toxin-type HINT domain-containing protein n=1 Tax=Paenibacillus camerounensis TaxID=1243663 RepID=UPI0005A6B6D3|nr:polymorphic toxin-type HINT domain-containing protein [Paenibacillus camerounensis]